MPLCKLEQNALDALLTVLQLNKCFNSASQTNQGQLQLLFDNCAATELIYCIWVYKHSAKYEVRLTEANTTSCCRNAITIYYKAFVKLASGKSINVIEQTDDRLVQK